MKFKIIIPAVKYVLAGFLLAVACFLALNAAMDPLSTSEFCGTACHEMKYIHRNWKESYHGSNELGIQVECIECHLPPREKYFTHLTAKSIYGIRDLYKHILGEYDADQARRKVVEGFSNKNCLHCHNDLLSSPSCPAAKYSHIGSLNYPADPYGNCLKCHPDAGHKNKNSLNPE